MATAQVNGSSTTSTSTKNRGGAAKNAGSSTIVDNVSLGDQNVGVFGSTVLDNAYTDKALSAGSFKYDNQRPVAKRVTTSLATVSKSFLQSGASDPTIARSIHKRESYKVSKVGSAYRKGYWNPYDGKFSIYGTYSRTSSTVTVTSANHGLATNDYVKLDFTSGAATDGVFQVTVSDENTFTITHTASGNTTGNVTVVGPAYATETVSSDEAASPTRSVPGELVYRTGSKIPVQDNYKSKTG